jgi:hypothetical protein
MDLIFCAKDISKLPPQKFIESFGNVFLALSRRRVCSNFRIRETFKERKSN